MLPIASDIAVRLTRAEALSALPHAPVSDDDALAGRAARRARRGWVASVLRRVADRLDPAPAHDG